MESAPYSALFQSRYIGPYPYLEESTFREAVTKFCQLGMLWCYCDDDDNIKFVSARPKLLQGELDRAYTWPRSRIYGTTTRDLFLRNRFRRVETQVNQVAMREETSSYSFSGYRVGSDNLPVSYSTDEDFLKDLQTDNAAIADDGGITLIRGAGSYNPTAIFAKFYSTISIGDRVKLNDTQVRIDASIYRQKTDTALGIGPLTGTTTLNVKGGVSVGEEETPPVGSFLAYYNIDILENSPDVEAGEIKVVHYVTLYQRPALTQTWQDQLLSVSVRVVICNVETKMVPKIYL